MLIFAVEGFDTDMYQVALPSVSGAVSPSTATVWPTKFSAWVFCAVCCSDTSVESWVLDLSCCSTWANCTSCWVNWLVSSGSSGFWFFSCVVSSVRKVWKLSAIPVVVVDVLVVLVLVAAAGAETTGAAVVASTAMVLSSDSDVDAAAGSQHAAVVAARRNGGNDGVFAHDHTMRLAPGLMTVLAVLLAR